MSRIDSLSVLGTDSGKLKLQEKYTKVIDNISTRLLSQQIKNNDLSGDINTGTLIAKRFDNAEAQDYGTARGNHKGSLIKAKEVVVAIDKNKEIIEEVENKDTLMLGVDGLIERRIANHKKVLETTLEKEFFKVAEEVATEVEARKEINEGSLHGDTQNLAENLDNLIQTIKTVKNNNVDGVDIEDIIITLNPKSYTLLRNYFDFTFTTDMKTEEGHFKTFHGVRIEENLHQTVDAIAMRVGSIAQPVRISVCNQGKVQLSDAYAFGLFFYYGTKAITPDLIFKSNIAKQYARASA